MKRVKAACICQTLHFMLKEDLGLGLAQRRVQEEMEHYKKGLDRSGTKYKIVEELPRATAQSYSRLSSSTTRAPWGTT